MRKSSNSMVNLVSIAIVTSIVLSAFLAVGPMIAVAPPLQATLTVTFTDLAPNTNTFPGDMNLTMIWLEMTASGGNVQVNSIDFEITGKNIDASEITSVALWDDYTPDKLQQHYECELAQNPVNNLVFTIPQAGTLDECTSVGSYTVDDMDTRYILVYLTVDSTADPTDELRLSVTAINTDGTVIGGTGTTRTLEVLTVFFLDDMESGQGQWTREGWDKGHMHEPDGLWHLSSGEEECQNNPNSLPFFHSSNTSWWYGHRWEDPYTPGKYGCGYYTWMPGNYLQSTHNMGNLTTPEIDATTGSSLSVTFWHMIMSEPDTPTPADVGYLWLYDVTEGTWHKINEDPYDSSQTNWWKVTLNLSAYAGKRVRLEFRFDTLDYMNNLWLGWFLDDLALYGKTVPHDIAVTDKDAPPVISPSGGTLDVTARYSNIGMSDETNIVTRLTIDNNTVDTGSIPSLKSGESVLHTLTWSPTTIGDHWICMEADPVPSETILWNNKECQPISVIDVPVHYVYVLRSDGTEVQAARDTWDYINANWMSLGSDQVIIDYTSLNMPSITYADISGQSPRPDVLVIVSSAGWMDGSVPPGREFTDTETAAITQYTLEGHGLLLVGSVFDELIPNNNDLTPLVGVTDQGYVRDWTGSLSIDSSCVGLPLFNNVNNPFSVPFSRTMSPADGNWGSGDLTTGQYCARSSNQSAAIVLNKGVYLMSFSATRMPNADMYQLLYNAMTTAQYQVFDHDVKVENIVAPNYARVGYSVNVSATVTNIGKNDEDVDVKLIVNSIQLNMTTIFLSRAGGFQRVTLSYTPATEGDDNVCMRADIVGFTDEDPSNNEVCRVVKSRYSPPVQVFVLDSWGTDNSALAPWDHLNLNWNLYGDTPVYIDYTTFNKENIRYQELVDMAADVLLISSSYTGQGENPGAEGHIFTFSEMSAIKQYVQEGHGIIITGGTFDSDKLPWHLSELGPLMGISSTETYMTTYGVYDMAVQNPAENHPLFANIPDHYNTANGTSLSPGFFMVGPEPWEARHLAGAAYKALENSPTPFGAVIAYEPGDYNAVYITNWVERSSNTYDKQLLYNAMVWGRSSVKGPSNLWIELFNGSADLRLTWTENPSPNLQGYNIYRANTVYGFNFGAPYRSVGVGVTEFIDTGTGVGDPNNYYYIVRAYDTKGNEEQNRNIVGKFIITLYPKNNEVSIPFELKYTKSSIVFSQINGLFNIIEAYDALTGMWKTWDGSGGLLTDVDHKMGLRIKMKASSPITDFVTVGRVPGMTEIEMYHELTSSYWNFVGFPRHLNTPLPQALDNYGMMGKYDIVLWYDPLDKKAHWKWFDPNDPNGSPLQELRPGMGIWVHTTQGGTWSLPGS